MWLESIQPRSWPGLPCAQWARGEESDSRGGEGVRERGQDVKLLACCASRPGRGQDMKAGRWGEGQREIYAKKGTAMGSGCLFSLPGKHWRNLWGPGGSLLAVGCWAWSSSLGKLVGASPQQCRPCMAFHITQVLSFPLQPGGSSLIWSGGWQCHEGAVRSEFETAGGLSWS